MKKILIIFVLFIVMSCSINDSSNKNVSNSNSINNSSTTTSQSNFSSNDNSTYSKGLEYVLKTYDFGEAYSVSSIGTCNDENIVIPDEHEGKKIVAIEIGAFYLNTKIKSVYFSNK